MKKIALAGLGIAALAFATPAHAERWNAARSPDDSAMGRHADLVGGLVPDIRVIALGPVESKHAHRLPQDDQAFNLSPT
jgi:hypothetical protein